jgi:hypothetical protein
MHHVLVDRLQFVPSFTLKPKPHPSDFPPPDWMSMPLAQRRTMVKNTFLSMNKQSLSPMHPLNLPKPGPKIDLGDPRAGSMQDVVQAFCTLPSVEVAVNRAIDKGRETWKNLEFPEKFVLVLIVSIPFAFDRSRNIVLSQLNGHYFDVPKIPGLSFTVGIGDVADLLGTDPTGYKPDASGFNFMVKLDLLEMFGQK